VEVDVLDRMAVDARLGLGERGEGAQSPGADPLLEVGLLDHGADVPPGPVRLVGREEVHVDLGRAHARPQDRGRLEPHRRGDDGVDGGLDPVEVDPGVDEGTEEHVAGDADTRIEPGDVSGRAGVVRHSPTVTGRGAAPSAPCGFIPRAT